MSVAASDVEALRGTIQSAINEGRIGTPQFFRCIATVSAKSGLNQMLTEFRTLAEGFFGGAPIQTHEMGNDSDYSTEMLKWAKGQSAIITLGRTMPNSLPQLDLMLIGSRGALYHENSLGDSL